MWKIKKVYMDNNIFNFWKHPFACLLYEFKESTK